jgi:hypothetical protein
MERARQARRGWVCVALGSVALAAAGATAAIGAAPVAKPTQTGCAQVSIEGQVAEGKGFQKIFAEPRNGSRQPALMLVVQPLASGWIVRVVAAQGPWGDHDRAELATPPYRSPNPLLVTTDFAFRAQDAVAWNPRHFRYAADARSFERLKALYPRVLANDGAAMADVARLTGEMPEGEFRILDAVLAPGTADQWRMAGAVASHLESTPHEVAQGVAPSPLGRILSLRFEVTIEVPPELRATISAADRKNPCGIRPTD